MYRGTPGVEAIPNGRLHPPRQAAASHEEKDKGERQKAEAHSTLAFSLEPSAFSL
jgi:hypothetical protein